MVTLAPASPTTSICGLTRRSWLARTSGLANPGIIPLKHAVGVAQEVSDLAEGHGEFLNPDRRVLIEVGSHLERSEDSDFDPAFEPVWDRRGNASLDQFQIPVFGIEDSILGLAVHGSKHRWRRLNWVVDIAAMISAHPGIDWEVMLLRAREWSCWRRLLTAVTSPAAFYRRRASPTLHQSSAGFGCSLSGLAYSLGDLPASTCDFQQRWLGYSLQPSDPRLDKRTPAVRAVLD